MQEENKQHAQAALVDAVIYLASEASGYTISESLLREAVYKWIASQQPAATPSAPTKVETVTLDGHQLRHALDLINPDGPENHDQLDEYLTFGIVQHKADDETVSTGMCCWNEDMGGEVMPLDGEWTTPPTPPQEAAARDERTAFERAFLAEGHPQKELRKGVAGAYVEGSAQIGWEFWQARAALAAPAAQV